MEKNLFSKKEAVRFGWAAMKNNLVFFVVFLIAAWVLRGIFSSLGSNVRGSLFYASGFLFSIVNFVVSTFVNMAETKISLRLSSAPGMTASIDDVWSAYPRFLSYLIGTILYALIVMCGFILLIVPGIVWAVKYSMFGYLIIDRDMPPVAAIKKSGEITMGAKWELFKLWLVFLGIIILGALALGVGLFAAYPTVLVAHAYVYRKLVGSSPTTEAAPADNVAPAEE